MKKFIVTFLILPILFSCSNISQKTSVSFSLSRSAAQTIINSNPDYSDIYIECSLSTEESNTITVPVQTVSYLLNGVEQTPTSENKLLIDDSEYLINSSLSGSVNKVVVSVEYKNEVKSEEIQFYVYDADPNSTAESQ